MKVVIDPWPDGKSGGLWVAHVFDAAPLLIRALLYVSHIGHTTYDSVMSWHVMSCYAMMCHIMPCHIIYASRVDLDYLRLSVACPNISAQFIRRFSC